MLTPQNKKKYPKITSEALLMSTPYVQQISTKNSEKLDHISTHLKLRCLLFLPGLKTAMTTVNDYNQLMKDFPLNDLLSATELDRIRVALQAIFLHMRKIRPTKYPIQRALRLVEAISRDLSTQLLKVFTMF